MHFAISYFPDSFFLKLTMTLHISRTWPLIHFFIFTCVSHAFWILNSSIILWPLFWTKEVFLKNCYSYSNSMFLLLCWIPLFKHSKCRIFPISLRYQIFSYEWFSCLVFAMRCPLDYLYITKYPIIIHNHAIINKRLTSFMNLRLSQGVRHSL